MPEELRDVIVRLERLEKSLGARRGGSPTANFAAEEIAAFHKVNAALWEDGSCGINETSPCVILRDYVLPRLQLICRPCDVECSCGPCNVFRPILGGGGRFGGLGG